MKRFRVYYWNEIKEMDMFKSIVKKNRDRLNDYCIVTVYDNYNEMYDNVDKIEKEYTGEVERDYAGRTYQYETTIRNGFKKWIGKSQAMVSFCRDELTYRTVNHEIGHIVYGYISKYCKRSLKCDYDKRGKGKQPMYEELMCYMIGDISDQIYSQLIS